MINKKSFILFNDSLDVLNELTDEQSGQLFKAIKNYQNNVDINISGLLKAIFINFENQFKRDNKVYEKICERNKINGSKGGRPITQITQSVIQEPRLTQVNPNNLDTDTDTDNDTDNDNKKDNKNKKEVFVKPSFQDVQKYCLERNNNIDANKFINFYESKGWLVGKNKMKNWKACIQTWELSNNTTNNKKEYNL